MSDSNNEAEKEFPFNIDAAGKGILSGDDLAITVYDGSDEIVYHGLGSSELRLPRGIYTVRTEFGNQWQDKIVRHVGEPGGTEIKVEIPQRASAAPLVNTLTSHEYYSDVSRIQSNQAPRERIGEGKPGTAGLFIFIRANRKRDYGGEKLWEGLNLYDFENNLISPINNQNGIWDDNYGSYSFSAQAAPGAYILRQSGETPRDIPIYLYPGWMTQIFIFFNKRPLIESSTILMNELGEGFDPNDEISEAVDIALTGLQNKTEHLPRKVMNFLLGGKFHNPMLGLIGAHFLLRQEQPDPGHIDTVIHNLDYLLPDSPDVKAISMMAEMKLNKAFLPIQMITHPPMLRAGLDALYQLSNESPELRHFIEEGSILDSIATRRYIDSPYSSWAPLPERSSPFNGSKRFAKQSTDMPWVEEFLRSETEISDEQGEAIDTLKYAKQLNIPERTVVRALNNIR